MSKVGEVDDEPAAGATLPIQLIQSLLLQITMNLHGFTWAVISHHQPQHSGAAPAVLVPLSTRRPDFSYRSRPAARPRGRRLSKSGHWLPRKSNKKPIVINRLWVLFTVECDKRIDRAPGQRAIRRRPTIQLYHRVRAGNVHRPFWPEYGPPVRDIAPPPSGRTLIAAAPHFQRHMNSNRPQATTVRIRGKAMTAMVMTAAVTAISVNKPSKPVVWCSNATSGTAPAETAKDSTNLTP